ncbi:hypothetical protein [Polyangium spumosum]|uniref:Suppressor of fused-like domain-containing protein n=1 Tax=Polyangium spumosum TaxID=889282 RepID=A0A6N7Q1N6_9BACT|nr:hypothetical protein [Polyangium spumosum]MRG98193.1 hypothetical protein [Polyangium spumosum]
MKDDAAIAAHFERHLGPAEVVYEDASGIFGPKQVYGVRPCEARPHWVLHTRGSSVFTLEGRSGEERRFEFVMSLPDTWNPGERWPAYIFRRACQAILFVGKAPADGGVFTNSAESIPGSPHVFALLVARSRQLGDDACFRVSSGRLVEIYAMYALTFDDFRKHQRHELDIATLPEVVVEWRDMLR